MPAPPGKRHASDLLPIVFRAVLFVADAAGVSRDVRSLLP